MTVIGYAFYSTFALTEKDKLMLKKILLLALLPAIAFAEELPAPVKAIEKQGITIIKTFDAPGGMKGYLGKYQDMGVTIYLTPDGKHAISGYMYNEKGENLSNTLIEKEIYKTVKDGKTNDPIRLAKLGKIFLELGDLSAAEAYLEKALSMLPNLGRAWYNLGITTLLQGRESETKRCILKAKLFDASDASICLYLENGESNLLLTKEGDYFLKVRTKEYYKKIHTWYRQKPEGQLIMVENIF